jgi:hypothetical protein
LGDGACATQAPDSLSRSLFQTDISRHQRNIEVGRRIACGKDCALRAKGKDLIGVGTKKVIGLPVYAKSNGVAWTAVPRTSSPFHLSSRDCQAAWRG